MGHRECMVRALKIGKLRAENGRRYNPDRTWNDGGIDSHVLGAYGECVFCEWCRLPLSMVKENPRGDGGIDFTINSYTIDVKGSRKTRINWPERERCKIAVLVLVQVQVRHDEITSGDCIGWRWGRDLYDPDLISQGIVEERPDHHRPGKTYLSIRQPHYRMDDLADLLDIAIQLPLFTLEDS